MAYERVLAEAGATRPARDSADQQLLREVQQRQASLSPPPEQAQDWPVLAPGSPYPDTDRDGMDDRWELEHGFDPEDPDDRNHDPDRDGYTNLEEFLNASLPH